MMANQTRDAWGLDVQPEHIPSLLKDAARWVVWMAVHEKDKVQKVPKRSNNPRIGASTVNPNDWSTFDEALNAYVQTPMVSGIGFVMAKPEGLFGIDLDKCVKNGVLEDWAQDMVDSLNIYWEYSPSQKGIRGFGQGELPGPSFLNHAEGVEMYGGDSPRFLTVTGHEIARQADDQFFDEDALAAVYNKYRTGASDTEKADIPMPVLLDSDELPDFVGDLAEHHTLFLLEGFHDDRYDSRSEALIAATLAMYRQDYTDSQVFSVLYECCQDVAMDHRHQDIDKATQYLWDQCLKALGMLRRDPSAFDDPEDEQAAPKNGLFWASAWQGQTVPSKEWLVKDWIPMGCVTALYGDGGVGKSLLALDLQTAIATGNKFFGEDTQQGRVIGMYCEDSIDDLHARQDGINTKYMVDYDDLDQSGVLSRLGYDNLLMTFDGMDRGKLSKLHTALCREIQKYDDIKCLIIDTAADTFGGNENNRPQVRQYIQHALGRIALQFNIAVVLCAHPSVAGMGEGTGGSTAWSNSVRSRLFIQRDPDIADMRLLTKKKSNYSSTGDIKRMLWRDGAFLAETAVEEMISNTDQQLQLTFINLLRDAIESGTNTSTSVRGNYAPRVLTRAANTVGRDDVTVSNMERAMGQLLASGIIYQEAPRHTGRGAHLAIREELL